MNEGTGREHYASSQTDRGRKAAVWNCTSFAIIFQNASASQRFSRSRCSRFHVQKCWGNKPCISLTIQRLDNIIVNKQLHRSKLQHEQIDDVEPPAGPLCKGFVGHCTSGHLFNPPLLVFETGASPLPVFPHATLVFLFMTPSLTFSYFKQRLNHIIHLNESRGG